MATLAQRLLMTCGLKEIGQTPVVSEPTMPAVLLVVAPMARKQKPRGRRLKRRLKPSRRLRKKLGKPPRRLAVSTSTG